MQETLRQYHETVTNAAMVNLSNQGNKTSLDSGLSVTGCTSLDKYCILNAAEQLEHSEESSFFNSCKLEEGM